MRNRRTHLVLVGALALVLSVTVGLTMTDAAVAKKKRKAGGTADITKQVNAPIPDATAPGPTWGVRSSTIDVGGKKFKKTKVRDVNVTVQTAGDQANSANDVVATLISPNGTRTWLFAGLGGQSIGPLTLDDETPTEVGLGTTARDSTQLVRPYAGTAQPFCFLAEGACPLAVLDNGPASGAWTLRVYDSNPGNTSSLSSWRLVVLAGKPYRTK
jgi:subtilisin-like proprotein convertase family protein